MEDTRKQKAKKKQAALDQDPETNSQSFSHLIPVKGIKHELAKTLPLIKSVLVRIWIFHTNQHQAKVVQGP